MVAKEVMDKTRSRGYESLDINRNSYCWNTTKYIDRSIH